MEKNAPSSTGASAQGTSHEGPQRLPRPSTRRYVAAAAALLLSACGDITEPRAPTAIEVDQESLQLQHGQSATVTATLRDQHGVAFVTPPRGYAIRWSSSAPGVASVNNGVITGVSAGHATITVEAGNLPGASVYVEVRPPLGTPTYLAVSLPGGGWIQNLALELDVGRDTTLSAVVLDEHHTPFPTVPAGYDITWSTVNPAVATAENGRITTAGVGLTWISVRAGGL